MRTICVIIFIYNLLIFQTVTRIIRLRSIFEVSKFFFLKESAIVLSDIHYTFNPNLTFIKVDGIRKDGSFIYNITCDTYAKFNKLMVTFFLQFLN